MAEVNKLREQLNQMDKKLGTTSVLVSCTGSWLLVIL
jgi:hypothetical protein